MSVPFLQDRYCDPTIVGAWASGLVYRLLDREAEESVAIKIVRPHLARLDRVRARFAREVALSGRLVHPNIVPVRDFGQLATGQPFVVMDFANRGSLADRMSEDLSIGLLLDWMDSVGSAWAFSRARAHPPRHQARKRTACRMARATSDPGWQTSGLPERARKWRLPGNRWPVRGSGWRRNKRQAGCRSQPWTDPVCGRPRAQPCPWRAPGSLEADSSRRFHPSPVELPDDLAPEVARVIRHLLHPDPRQRYDRAADVRRALHEARVAMADGAESKTVSTTVIPTTTTTFPVPLTQRGLATVANLRPLGGASPDTRPAWNRVAPDTLPEALPTHCGVGAPSHALRVYSLREPPPPTRSEVQQAIWDAAHEVVQQARTRVILLVGRDGSGKGRMADAYAEILDEGGFMESVTLRYHDPPEDDDGFRGRYSIALALG